MYSNWILFWSVKIPVKYINSFGEINYLWTQNVIFKTTDSILLYKIELFCPKSISLAIFFFKFIL